MKKLIKLFWRLTTDKFLLRELQDHNAQLYWEGLLNDKERQCTINRLNNYIIPEMLRRGL